MMIYTKSSSFYGLSLPINSLSFAVSTCGYNGRGLGYEEISLWHPVRQVSPYREIIHWYHLPVPDDSFSECKCEHSVLPPMSGTVLFSRQFLQGEVFRFRTCDIYIRSGLRNIQFKLCGNLPILRQFTTEVMMSRGGIGCYRKLRLVAFEACKESSCNIQQSFILQLMNDRNTKDYSSLLIEERPQYIVPMPSLLEACKNGSNCAYPISFHVQYHSAEESQFSIAWLKSHKYFNLAFLTCNNMQIAPRNRELMKKKHYSISQECHSSPLIHRLMKERPWSALEKFSAHKDSKTCNNVQIVPSGQELMNIEHYSILLESRSSPSIHRLTRECLRPALAKFSTAWLAHKEFYLAYITCNNMRTAPSDQELMNVGSPSIHRLTKERPRLALEKFAMVRLAHKDFNLVCKTCNSMQIAPSDQELINYGISLGSRSSSSIHRLTKDCLRPTLAKFSMAWLAHKDFNLTCLTCHNMRIVPSDRELMNIENYGILLECYSSPLIHRLTRECLRPALVKFSMVWLAHNDFNLTFLTCNDMQIAPSDRELMNAEHYGISQQCCSSLLIHRLTKEHLRPALAQESMNIEHYSISQECRSSPLIHRLTKERPRPALEKFSIAWFAHKNLNLTCLTCNNMQIVPSDRELMNVEHYSIFQECRSSLLIHRLTKEHPQPALAQFSIAWFAHRDLNLACLTCNNMQIVPSDRELMNVEHYSIFQECRSSLLIHRLTKEYPRPSSASIAWVRAYNFVCQICDFLQTLELMNAGAVEYCSISQSIRKNQWFAVSQTPTSVTQAETDTENIDSENLGDTSLRDSGDSHSVSSLHFYEENGSGDFFRPGDIESQEKESLGSPFQPFLAQYSDNNHIENTKRIYWMKKNDGITSVSPIQEESQVPPATLQPTEPQQISAEASRSDMEGDRYNYREESIMLYEGTTVEAVQESSPYAQEEVQLIPPATRPFTWQADYDSGSEIVEEEQLPLPIEISAVSN